MFNNITSKYDLSSATLEILVMLLGAFILGYLLRHVLGCKNVNVHHSLDDITDKATGTVEIKDEAVDMTISTTENSNIKAKDMTVSPKLSIKEAGGTIRETTAKTTEEIVELLLPTDKDNDITISATDKPNLSIKDAGDIVRGTTSKTTEEVVELILPVDEVDDMTVSPKFSIKAANGETVGTTSNMSGLFSEDLNMASELTLAEPETFQKVEGIGPMIEVLLWTEGVLTMKDLAATDISKFHEILEEAGPRYAMHNPKSWSQQAELILNKNWDELEKYQGSL